MFAINSFSTSSKININGITLKNLKSKLLQYEFENKITIKCIKDDLSCFVFLDDDILPQEDKIMNLFKKEPNIYSYKQDSERLEFVDLELEQLQRYEVFLELNCKKNQKCSEFVLELPNKVMIFNNIYSKPIELKYLSDVEDLIQNNVQEVKDAF